MPIRLVKTIKESTYKLIIFDCDGTLVDSEALSCTVAAQMMRSYGISITDREAEDRFGGTSLDYIRQYITESIGALPDDFTQVFRREQRTVFEADLKAIDGVKSFLDKISIPICIGSNAPMRKMEMTLPLTGLAKYFQWDHVFSAYELEKWKPEPDLFLHAAKVMGHAPNECLVIEDSIAGATGAINANMDVVVFAGDQDKANVLETAGFPVFRSFKTFGQTFFSI